MLNEVSYEGGVYPRVIIRKMSTSEDEPNKSFEIPMQAIADRMELLGLESIEQALEYIGREFNQGDISDTLHEPMQDAYRDVVQSEYAQTLMPMPRVDEGMHPQTLIQPMRIERTKRDKLRDVRSDVLNKLNMRSKIHREPMALALDESRPMDRTRPAAAEALGATEEAVAEAVRLVQENVEELKAWRGFTVLSYTPQLAEYLDAQNSPEER